MRFAFVDEVFAVMAPTGIEITRTRTARLHRAVTGFLPEKDVALLARLAACEEQQAGLDELRRRLA
jgi:hypothetical protein